jgi:DNA-binding IclR family transcriptional regulator
MAGREEGIGYEGEEASYVSRIVLALKERAAQSADEIAAALGVSVSHVVNLCSVLEKYGLLVSAAGTGRYSLGVSVLGPASRALSDCSFGEIAGPYVRRLARLTEASAFAGVSGEEVILIRTEDRKEEETGSTELTGIGAPVRTVGSCLIGVIGVIFVSAGDERAEAAAREVVSAAGNLSLVLGYLDRPFYLSLREPAAAQQREEAAQRLQARLGEAMTIGQKCLESAHLYQRPSIMKEALPARRKAGSRQTKADARGSLDDDGRVAEKELFQPH